MYQHIQTVAAISGSDESLPAPAPAQALSG